MKLQDLKHAIDQIEIDKTMQQEIIRQVSEKTEDRKTTPVKHKTVQRKHPYFPRIAATAAGVLLLVGGISIPARALVSSLVQERMESLPAKERQEMVEMLDSQTVDADSYSRDYTPEEKSRMSELYRQYQQGVFPEEELPQADSMEQVKDLELCYLTTTSSFYLPDRELTDEELLQIIDFETKRNYVLQKRYEEEYADEIAENAREQEKQIEQAVNEGGITEQEAAVEAQKWLNKIYGITGDGLEMSSHLETGEFYLLGERDLYIVIFTDAATRQHYYFYIRSRDGIPAYISYSSASNASDAELTPDELEEVIPELKEKAVSFVTEKLGEDMASYAEKYVSYYVYNGQRAATSIKYIFVKEDKTACIAEYLWDGTFYHFYNITDIDLYRQRKEERVQYNREHGDANGNPQQIEEQIINMDEL